MEKVLEKNKTLHQLTVIIGRDFVRVHRLLELLLARPLRALCLKCDKGECIPLSDSSAYMIEIGYLDTFLFTFM